MGYKKLVGVAFALALIFSGAHPCDLQAAETGPCHEHHCESSAASFPADESGEDHADCSLFGCCTQTFAMTPASLASVAPPRFISVLSEYACGIPESPVFGIDRPPQLS